MRPDLIETLWNVKKGCSLTITSDIKDLIETLWNVKGVIVHCEQLALLGFNRDIVECKVKAG